MPTTGRSCDRCCSIKTRCDGSVPCGRCARLGIECLHQRPLLRRGRPKKPSSGRRASRLAQVNSPERSSSGDVPTDDRTYDAGQPLDTADEPSLGIATSPTAFDRTEGITIDAIDNSTPGSSIHATGGDRGISDDASGPEDAYGNDDLSSRQSSRSGLHSAPLDDMSALGLDESSAQQILDLLLGGAAGLGMPCILAHLGLSSGTMVDCLKGLSGPDCPIELCFALLAIGMELQAAHLPGHTQASKEMIVDTLRIEFLKRVPTLTWKSSDINICQCVALTLASYTWCLNRQLADVANRWNGIAQLLLRELVRVKRDSLDASLLYRLTMGLQIQAVVLAFVHGESVFSTTTAGRLEMPVSPSMDEPSPADVYNSVSQHGDGQPVDYFALFMPLVKPFQQVCKLQADSSPDQADGIRDALECYYLGFPPHLLEFSALVHPYQAEAMIWFHGIFILTYVPRNLPYLITSSELQDTPHFYSALEHALLLGEVLPTLHSLDSQLQSLSPATVGFITLSASMIAAALWQFHSPLSTTSSVRHQMPSTLLASAASYRQLLEVLERVENRFDSVPIEPVQRCLEALGQDLDPSSLEGLQSALVRLSRCDPTSGLGMQISTPHFQNQGIGLLAPPAADVAATHRAAIEALCSPDARPCQPGCFDLSIQF